MNAGSFCPAQVQPEPALPEILFWKFSKQSAAMAVRLSVRHRISTISSIWTKDGLEKGIINNSKTKIILNLEDDEAMRVQTTLHLSDEIMKSRI